MNSLLLLVACLASANLNSADMPEIVDSFDYDIVYLPTDTTGFSDYQSIFLGTVYCATFDSRRDIDYYRFDPSSSGIYSFYAANNLNISISIYGVFTDLSRVSLCSYNIGASETDLGFNYGFFYDTSIYSFFYIVVSSFGVSANQPYFLSVDYLALRNSAMDLFCYDVDTGFYSSLAFSSVGSGAISTSGYNPNGSSTITFQNYPSGTDVALINGGTVDTLTTYPFSSVGAFKNGHDSTAFLIGPNVMVTAAHCVGDECHIKDFVSTEHVYFGANLKNPSNYASIGNIAQVYLSPYRFLAQDKYAYDWAFCILDSECGNDVGYIPIAQAEYYLTSTTNKLVVDGYKGGGAAQTLSYANYISRVGTEIRYDNVTASGDSGAPIISYDYGKVMAIHTGAVGNLYSAGIYFDTYRFALAETLILGGTL